jgi:hypothetical protein
LGINKECKEIRSDGVLYSCSSGLDQIQKEMNRFFWGKGNGYISFLVFTFLVGTRTDMKTKLLFTCSLVRVPIFPFIL